MTQRKVRVRFAPSPTGALHTGRRIILEIGDFLPFGIQLFGGIECDISTTGVQQLIDILLVNIPAFALTVRPVFASEELDAKRKEIPNFQYDASTRMQMRNSLIYIRLYRPG